MKLTHGLVLAALLAAGPALAATAVNRLEFQAPLRPAVGGWYSSQTNLGGVTFDIINSDTRPIVAGNWTYFENGTPKTGFFQGDMQYKTPAEALSSGLIASFDIPTFELVGRSDYVDPVFSGGTALMTGRTVRMEFESSRAGTFIDNLGQPDERRFPVVASLRGLPLVAPTDYSGEWVASVRFENPGAHYQSVGIVKIRAYSGPEMYNVTSLFGNSTPGGVPIPDSDARRYEVTCPDTGSSSTACALVHICGLNCLSGREVNLLWMNADEKGSFAGATAQSSNTALYDIGWPSMVAYGYEDQIVIRAKRISGIIEMQFNRLPAGVFSLQGSSE